MSGFLFFFPFLGKWSKGGIRPAFAANWGYRENTPAERAPALARNCLKFNSDALAQDASGPTTKHRALPPLFAARETGAGVVGVTNWVVATAVAATTDRIASASLGDFTVAVTAVNIGDVGSRQRGMVV